MKREKDVRARKFTYRRTHLLLSLYYTNCSFKYIQHIRGSMGLDACLNVTELVPELRSDGSAAAAYQIERREERFCRFGLLIEQFISNGLKNSHF